VLEQLVLEQLAPLEPQAQQEPQVLGQLAQLVLQDQAE
jgi:hypothetical protein